MAYAIGSSASSMSSLSLPKTIFYFAAPVVAGGYFLASFDATPVAIISLPVVLVVVLVV